MGTVVNTTHMCMNFLNTLELDAEEVLLGEKRRWRLSLRQSGSKIIKGLQIILLSEQDGCCSGCVFSAVSDAGLALELKFYA